MKSKHILLLVTTICLILFIAVSFSQNLQLKDNKQQTSLDSKVAILESKVTALESKVTSLEARIDKLQDQISNPKTKVVPLHN